MNVRVSHAIRHLCEAVPSEHEWADGELVNAFVQRRDAAAFEQLVRRHGPMVLGVCRRVLGNAFDADDAFQATFLVLARRAASVVPREMVGNWLYGVAYRTALEARRMAARRRARETHAAQLALPVAPEAPGHDLSSLLDQELSRLPDRLRLPVVLCDLEGRTRRAVARQLGIPDGTLSNRLAAARRLLAKRLARRGVTLPAGGLAIFLARDGSSAVPASLLSTTIRAALAASPEAVSATVGTLTHEVMKAMYLTKLKVVTATIVAVTVLAGAGVWGGHALTAEPQSKSPTPVDPKSDAPATVELRGVLDKAAETVKGMPAADDVALEQKVQRLVNIAHYQARYGKKESAAKIFLDAVEVACQIKADEKRAESLANAGFYQANAGLTDDARKSVEKITLKSELQTQEYRGRVLTEVASALAKAGDFKEATKVAESIPERVIKVKRKGKDEEHRNSIQRDFAFKHIAEAQEKSRDLAGAVKTARAMKDEGQRLSVLQELVLGYAKAGDAAGAGKLFDDVRKEMEASETYDKKSRRHTIAMLQAAIGDAEGAMKSIEKLETADDRADAYFGVSIGLAYRETWKKKP